MRTVTVVLVVAAAADLATPAGADRRCGGPHGQPCTLNPCSTLHGMCQPEPPFPFGDGLRLTVQSREHARPPPPSDRPLNTLQELFAAIETCWKPPPLEESRPGTQITIRFSLTRSGEILGEPLYTYSSPALPHDVKAAYQRAVAATLDRCTPFHLSDALGGAIAGRPISTRFIDDRGTRRTENSP